MDKLYGMLIKGKGKENLEKVIEVNNDRLWSIFEWITNWSNHKWIST